MKVRADWGSTDYYAVLGVGPTATKSEIRARYRTLARSHHPDAGGSTQRMQQLNEAFEVLGNPLLKIKYDTARQRIVRPKSPVVPTSSPVARSASSISKQDSKKPDPYDYRGHVRKPHSLFRLFAVGAVSSIALVAGIAAFGLVSHKAVDTNVVSAPAVPDTSSQQIASALASAPAHESANTSNVPTIRPTSPSSTTQPSAASSQSIAVPPANPSQADKDTTSNCKSLDSATEECNTTTRKRWWVLRDRH
jgi:hypothetical protein